MKFDFTVAICSYNRGQNLPELIRVLRQQKAPIPFDILVVDNNSTDDTQSILSNLARQEGVPLRYVLELNQGISFARNRAINECIHNEFMAFIDDDELPQEGFVAAAYDALTNEKADCVGGSVEIALKDEERPKWLVKDLLGFLAEVDYGNQSFWIKDRSKPIWTCNIAYRMSIFRDNPDLRFDIRFNRKGQEVGGGEDAVMFWALLEENKRIRFRHDMKVSHFVEKWRLKRSYFLKLHFVAGRRFGQFKMKTYPRTVFGVPPFLLLNLLRDWYRAIKLFLSGKPALRQAMNGAFALGIIWGIIKTRDK